MDRNFEKRKPRSKCFVPGCTSGYKSNKNKVTLFCVPRNETLFKKWKNTIPRSDKELNQNSVICELHFDVDFIEKNYKYVIEGQEVFLPRTTPRLTMNAFPTIFPNLTSDLSKQLPAECNIQSNVYTKPNSSTEEPQAKQIKIVSVESCSSTSFYTNSNFSNSFKILELENISLPSMNWSKIVCGQDMIMFTCYNTIQKNTDIKSILRSLANPDKIVYIKMDGGKLLCTVYAHYHIVKTWEATPNMDIKTKIENILRETNDLKLCSGSGSISEVKAGKKMKNLTIDNNIVRSASCTGCVLTPTRSNKCIHCKCFRKRLLNMKYMSRTKLIKNRKLQSRNIFQREIKVENFFENS